MNESEFVERIVIEGDEHLAVTKRSLINFADSIGIAENRCSKVLTDLIMNIATVCLGHYPTIYDRSNNKDEETPQLLSNGVIYLGENVPPAWKYVAYGFEPKEFVKQINRALRDDTEFKRGFGKLTKLIVTKPINAIDKSPMQE